MTDLEVTFESPCVRNCCLDENDICLGCHRSMDEIMAWASMSKEEQKDVLRRAQERAANSHKRNALREE